MIDVDLNSVVYGVAAAYPLMVRQGAGHIVNTASLAGLVPSPLLDPLRGRQVRPSSASA